MRILVLVLFAAVCPPVHALDLKFAYNESFRPLSYRDGGSMKGLLIDLVDELGRRTGFRPIHEGLPWERAQNQVRSGASHAMVTVLTPDRAQWSVAVPTPAVRLDVVGITSKTNPHLAALRKVKTMEETFAFSQVNSLGSGWAHLRLAKANVTYLSRPEQIFAFLVANRADLFLENAVLIHDDATRLGFSDQLEVLPRALESVQLHLLISKKAADQDLIDRLDEGLREMTADGTLERMMSRYGQ